MTSTRAKRLVLLAMMVAGTAASLRAVTAERRLPSARIPIGVFAAGIMLAVLAEFAPELAGSLALLIVVASLTVSADTWTGIQTATARRAGTPPASPIFV